MDNDFDFVPPVFFRILVFVSGIYVLIVGAFSIGQSAVNVYSVFTENLVANLNRLGLVFELIGLLSLLPDVMERKALNAWEKRLNSLDIPNGNVKDVLKYLLRNFSLENTSTVNGLIGFTNQVSRLLGVILLSVMTFTLPKNSFSFDDIGFVLLCLTVIGYCWLVIELVNTKLHYTQDYTGVMVLKVMRVVAFWSCVAIIFFLPVLFVSMTVILFLNWIAKHPLAKIIVTITFPFILLGTVFQLIASFL